MENIYQNSKVGEEWCSPILKNIDVAVISTDIEGKIVFLNPIAESLTGWKYEDAIGKSLEDVFNIINRQTQKPIKIIVKKFLREGLIVGLSKYFVLKTKNGKEIPISNSIAPIKDNKGNFIGVVLIFQNVAEQKKVEDKFQENEKRFRDVAENILEWVWEVDANGKYTYSSSVVKKILGYKPEEMLKKHFYDTFHPEDREQLKKAAFEIFAKTQPFREFIGRYMHKNGKIVWLSTSGIAILDEKGKLLGYRGADIDITERKRAEERLHLLSSAVEQSTEGIAISDLKGNLLFVNNAFATMHGYTLEELIGKHLSIFHTPEQRSAVEKANKQIQEKGAFNGEIWHVRKNGKVFPTLMHNSLLRDKMGNPIGLIATIRDITEQKRIEQKLREQNIELKKLDRLKNDFITIIAHELKTPIISIRGYPDFLLTKYNNIDPELKDDLIKVKNNAIRLETNINQLLEIMKIDSNKINLILKRENIYNIIKNSVSELSLVIKQKELNLEICVEKGLFLNVDSFRISQLFSNLIFNAIKFTPKFGNIKISAEQLVNQCLFKVKDSGTGLTKDEIKILFEKFATIEQEPENISAFRKGSGLGLYIAKGIVKAHGGRIWISSEGKGKGAEILFTLPNSNS